MSSTSPPRYPQVDKGKGIAKPRKRRNNYVLNIPPRPLPSIPALYMPSSSSLARPTGLHTPTSIPTLHLSSSSFMAPPIGSVIPISIPALHIPSSSSSSSQTNLHTCSTHVAPSTSPHVVPSPTSIDAPSSIIVTTLHHP